MGRDAAFEEYGVDAAAAPGETMRKSEMEMRIATKGKKPGLFAATCCGGSLVEGSIRFGIPANSSSPVALRPRLTTGLPFRQPGKCLTPPVAAILGPAGVRREWRASLPPRDFSPYVRRSRRVAALRCIGSINCTAAHHPPNAVRFDQSTQTTRHAPRKSEERQ